MKSKMTLFFLLITFLIILSYTSSIVCHVGVGTNDSLSTYIIHVQPISGHSINSDDDLKSWYRSFLPTSTSNSHPLDRLLYAYSEVFQGFAARLTVNELKEMSKKPGYVQSFPESYLHLQTTHTPTYLGLKEKSGLWLSSNLGEGVVIGVLDTGILPGHPSFSDDGVPPPPKKWKGHCNFTKGCNNKIIGARTYIGTKGGPIDNNGHGSHTASTIAGNFVEDVNAFGSGNGTMSGMAPHAHLAIYQICGELGCPSSAILAAFDDAVKDGVDVLSLSLGANEPQPLDQDPVAIASFKATEKGITVVCAGGNNGPQLNSVVNEAPWIVTAAASSVDRSFRVTVKLDDGDEVYGEFLDQPFNFITQPFPLYRDRDLCTLPYSESAVKGKIVLCPVNFILDEASFAKKGRAVGIIYFGAEKDGSTKNLLGGIGLPGAFVSFEDGMKIEGSRSSTASLYFNRTVLDVSPAPTIASFSSRGPATVSPRILKPDITAPGLNIIAAWSSNDADKSSKVPVNVLSGTSMATPHVSGVAALIKSVHPNWSPSAIKSAMVTTSDFLGNDGQRIRDEHNKVASFFISGAGHINASKAASPGLVYETNTNDYIAYLCSILDESKVSLIVGKTHASCSRLPAMIDSELNYPTITVSLSKGVATIISRTVTNVGQGKVSYGVRIDVPDYVTVSVNPEKLHFNERNEKKSFTVTVSSKHAAEGNLMWVSDNGVVVRSALVITE